MLFILVLGDNTIKYKIEKIMKLFLILILLIMETIFDINFINYGLTQFN